MRILQAAFTTVSVTRAIIPSEGRNRCPFGIGSGCLSPPAPSILVQLSTTALASYRSALNPLRTTHRPLVHTAASSDLPVIVEGLLRDNPFGHDPKSSSGRPSFQLCDPLSVGLSSKTLPHHRVGFPPPCQMAFPLNMMKSNS